MKEDDTQNAWRFSERSLTGRVKIRLMGGLHRGSIGKENCTEYVDIPSTLGHLLDQLRMKYQLEIRRDSTLILVNGIEARALDDLETSISEDDELVLVPMFHGG